MNHDPRYLLLQMRNADDPMRDHEVGCFARALECPRASVAVHDLIAAAPADDALDAADVVLLGGSGDYSVVDGGPWLSHAMETMRRLHDDKKPTFASCWGFQAMARALGGEVVHDASRAELGTHSLRLTSAGREDPLFGPLGSPFQAQMGHQDIVERLPEDAVLLASTDTVSNQAFRFREAPIYCTQFHCELHRDDLLLRVRAYPQYIEKIAGMTYESFAAACVDTPETAAVLKRFVRWALGHLS
jgi:GMP synthase (glutamine-hydrolysing)